LANITLHYVILPITAVINQSVLFKRFIDDIIWIYYGLDNTTVIRQSRTHIFSDNELELSICQISTSEACLEFLDVEHKIDQNYLGRFYTRDYVKPTALW